MVNVEAGMDMAFGILMFFILAGTLLPVGFDMIFGANTSSWDTDTVTLFELLPLIGAVAAVFLVGGWAYKSYK